jgi:hypothetical protein
MSGFFTTGSCINYLARLFARCSILMVSLAFDGAITKLGAVLWFQSINPTALFSTLQSLQIGLLLVSIKNCNRSKFIDDSQYMQFIGNSF